MKHPNLYENTERPKIKGSPRPCMNCNEEGSPGGFGDSAEATDYMLDIAGKMDASILDDWASMTDENYGTDTLSKLRKAREAYEAFWDEMDSAQ